MSDEVLESWLLTPPLPLLVSEGVFDDFGWCRSERLLWRRPAGAWDDDSVLDGSDPARMVFVMHQPVAFLPQELARLHAPGLGLGEELALAPYGIDDATDGLHEHRVEPQSVLWLAADNLNALFWGLHDWAHFHNHGPFERVAETELQCDASALVWLSLNAKAVGLSAERWERLRQDVVALGSSRFAGEGRAFDAAWLGAERLRSLLLPSSF